MLARIHARRFGMAPGLVTESQSHSPANEAERLDEADASR